MALTEPIIVPDWPAHSRVHALMTTRAFGDMGADEGRQRLRKLVPDEPAWLRQVHGTAVVAAILEKGRTPHADAAVAREPGSVCVVMAADCMPVLLASQDGTAVAAAHAGWRGLCAGVVEAALDAMQTIPQQAIAWLGPAIGPRAYEVGAEVRAAFLAQDAGAERAFRPSARAGHWMLDLYAIARQRLEARGVKQVYGGGYCTATDKDRFFSYRRDRASERMAAVIWLS